jgi:TrmH family RNA methyltransferase
MATSPRIVLVRPRNPLNIGAAARAMANFGLEELVVVDPHPPVWADALEEARRSARGAETVLRDSRCVPTLDEALEGCAKVAGTTAGSRRNIGRTLQPPAILRRAASRGRLAILFGSEKTGLGNDELSYCHFLIRVPTTASAPSMNLAQAVVICCYEWARGKPLVRAAAAEKEAPADSLFRLLEIITPALEASAFFEARPKAGNLRRLRRMLLNAKLSPEDASLLTQAARMIEYKMGLRPSSRRSPPPDSRPGK